MARMADAFMKGYSFVDNIQRQHKADDRLVTLQNRDDKQYANQQEDRVVNLADADVTRERKNTLWNNQQTDRAKKQAEDKIYAEYSGKLFAAMNGSQQKLYEKGIAALPPKAQGEKGKAVVADAIINPDKISKALYSWDNVIIPALESGKFPEKQPSLDVMNTVLHPELQARFAKNGLSGKLTDIVPSPDGKGLYFDTAVNDAYGRTYNAPLTDGASSVNEQDSGSHVVQNLSVKDTMAHTGNAVETYRGILATLARDGGKAGRELAFKIMKSQQDTKAGLTKERRDHAWDEKKIGMETAGKLSVAKIKARANSLKDQIKTLKERIKDGGGTGTMKSKDRANIMGKIQGMMKDFPDWVKIPHNTLRSINEMRKEVGLSTIIEKIIPGKQDTWWMGDQSTPDKYMYGTPDEFVKVRDKNGNISIMRQDMLPQQAETGSTLAQQEPTGKPIKVQGQSIVDELESRIKAKSKAVSNKMPSSHGSIMDSTTKPSEFIVSPEITTKVGPIKWSLLAIKEGDHSNGVFEKLARELIEGARESNKGIKQIPRLALNDFEKIIRTFDFTPKNRIKLKKILSHKLEGSTLH